MEKSSEYKELIKVLSPKSHSIKNLILSFIIGGVICLFGEVIAYICLQIGVKSEDCYTWVTIIIILLSALLTGTGVFDKLARHAGAGTLVPVSGFANSVVSPAIDNKAEGFILGVGAKIFTVAGPVILYATVSGFIYGAIYYTVNLFL